MGIDSPPPVGIFDAQRGSRWWPKGRPDEISGLVVGPLGLRDDLRDNRAADDRTVRDDPGPSTGVMSPVSA